MVRKNEKTQLINYESSIVKSNEISLAKLNHGLTLNQMQLLAYAIYCTQQNGNTIFRKVEFENKFNIEKYQTIHARDDSEKLIGLKVSTEDLANEKFKFWNVFMSMEYEEGTFRFEWNPKMIPHILDLKEKYITTDLTITSKFKSSFSWILYDYLKAHYGYWHKPISKGALIRLFGVENKKTYQNTAQFKRGVLDVAIKEINKYTELQVSYKEIKTGRAITGFDLHWSNGSTQASATKKQILELKAIVDVVFEDVFRYVNLKSDEARERAINLVKELEEYSLYTSGPICITKDRADFLLMKSNEILRELEILKGQDNNKVPLYNWLEERE
ncbi:replication initiation protein [Ureibacillus endophyticus]|uniref:RepB family plasmid replication initiator protein n=1 Tax=Ureibacillus endophyticus TaxID=1978490 RepID=A0A494YTM6_9BACL|nr:replication initiation protein [Lysinibacillus endophyticus]RKQ13450.1 RepB family plasmid replication initiator protein [Lysinibacillus endophyticus]